MAFIVFAAACLLVLIFIATFVMQQYFVMRRVERERIKQLEGERELYDALRESKSEVSLVLNASNRIPSYVGGDPLAFMGIKREDILADIYALSRGVEPKLFNDFRDEFAKWDKKGRFEFEFKFKHLLNGKIKYAHLSIAERGGELVALIRDVTTEAEDRERLRDDLDEAKNNNEFRNEFISNISNEIRMPITSMKGQLQLAQINAEKPEEVRRFTSGVSSQTDKLLALLNDMIDISKMESGDITLEEKEFDIMASAKKLEDTYAEAAKREEIEFSLDTTDLNARYFIGDELRLQQILIAFVEHAQRVTKKGGRISVNIRRMNHGSDIANMLFRVTDTGRRMSKQKALEMLEAGTGGNISIAVANQLVSYMGGQIVFNSDDNGNDFSIFIHFPLADREQDMSAPIDMEEELINKNFTYNGCRILLAHGSEDDANVYGQLLEAVGANVDVVYNGQDAVDRFMKGGSGRYHVMLLSVSMPVMSGIAVAKRIRSLYGSEAKTIPMIGLLEHGHPDDRRSVQDAGMNGAVEMPLDIEALKQELARFL